ncbi:metalloregulator ArsR/SmtB family transcription factor [Rudanella paleaurantiibacter]|jgi:DNA-binding transcriptional ArsR family regulator|uniref:Winged helix-turn-helix transcriptional regulator n=4 Tax=Cytophagales TaxID=768507 RepID=A0A5R9KM12_9BACT|nr:MULTISPECIES: metalloregulator ArsR/SmtB family transcription factor [Cytophagales]MBE8970159.1 winged helix-turn-helix transcriptional regulator [Nostocales cyanobacterium LEGE 12452]KAA9341108.1 winged helix-turn-helix transcriptional regulator [Larkinella humicola]KAB7725162.1 metalloregulator ArsR/SmtB family transcription factor [Rudanella paleaurantiibacter]TLU97245.1 winged helix-turn-helix transcriptional regulator [Dyadobacter sediminis]TLU97257.1 winged helix-turn-helix transcript
MEDVEKESDQISSCIRLFADQEQIQLCKETLDENEDAFTRLAQVYALAGNEARLKILYLIQQQNELCPCDLSDILQMTVPAISQHLRKLKDASLVRTRKTGQTIFYSIIPDQASIIGQLFVDIPSQESVAL